MVESSEILLMLKHCDVQQWIYAFSPTSELANTVRCPLCYNLLWRSAYLIAPVKAAPLINRPLDAHHAGPGIALLPSPVGQRFFDYQLGQSLHIGAVMGADGYVVHYDEKGLSCDQYGWNEALWFSLDAVADGVSFHTWISTLQTILTSHASSEWTADRYRVGQHDCFAFVIKLLHCVMQRNKILECSCEADPCADERASLSKLFLPHLTALLRRSALVRCVTDGGGAAVVSDIISKFQAD